MEWVETTGSTVEEAKEAALDQLGVDEPEAEFEVLEEPRSGLFGRSRGSARVRARVVPVAPPPKTDRRRRGRKGGSDGVEAASGSATTQVATTDDVDRDATASEADSAPRARRRSRREDDDRSSGTSGGRSREPQASYRRKDGPKDGRGPADADGTREKMDMDDQIRVLEEFLVELAARFGLTVTASSSVDGNQLTVDLSGEGLGILVGPRLATLDAVQEIARNTLQRHAAGREYAKVVVDVEGIRSRRRESLTSFVNDAAGQVLEDDVEVVLEVMSSVDRKQVHDVVADLDGVESTSEGEDPRRRVVLRRA